MRFDGVASPWLAEVLPEAFTAEKTPILVTGALLSYVTFTLGWLLFAIISCLARVVPLWLAIALAVGGLLGFRSGLPPYGIRSAWPWPHWVCG